MQTSSLLNDVEYTALADKLGMSDAMVKREHITFLDKYKNGFVSRNKFLEVPEEVLVENANLADSLFKLFDKGKP